jgi:hypothetical protein
VLTKDTKDRIDRARQILVGQLPLPSDQIELITIALIYKFMDDMDEQSRDLGGQASFFVGKLRDYSWREIVANKLDAKERVDRFVKGVEQLSDPKDNPIPELFQSIFRNTFVKFRDGRTLKLFLDELNGFTYDHSEELGNAFEYLLETMGTPPSLRSSGRPSSIPRAAPLAFSSPRSGTSSLRTLPSRRKAVRAGLATGSPPSSASSSRAMSWATTSPRRWPASRG